MRADLSKSDGPITAVATNHVPMAAEFDQFVTLAFWQNGSGVTLFLPAKMAACADMIAGAFNAHMGADPGVGVREQVARERGAGGGGAGVGAAGSHRDSEMVFLSGGGNSGLIFPGPIPLTDEEVRIALEGKDEHEHTAI